MISKVEVEPHSGGANDAKNADPGFQVYGVLLGDATGINDSSAFAPATVGIALGLSSITGD
jgi:hypothetical protein